MHPTNNNQLKTIKYENLLFLVAITFTMLFTACSKNDESEPTDEEKALAHQEEMYQAMKKDIIGHWKGAQQFDEKWSGEWEAIPYWRLGSRVYI